MVMTNNCSEQDVARMTFDRSAECLLKDTDKHGVGPMAAKGGDGIEPDLRALNVNDH